MYYCKATNGINSIVVMIIVFLSCPLLHYNYMHISFGSVQADLESRSSSLFMLSFRVQTKKKNPTENPRCVFGV